MRVKTLAWISTIAILAPACNDTNLDETIQKSATDSPLKNAQIVAASSEEPIPGAWTRFSVNIKENAKLIWKASPRNSVQLKPQGNEVAVNFGEPGVFRLTAIDSLTQDSTYTEVIVKPVLGPDYRNQPILSGDELYITPVSLPDSSHFLSLALSTKFAYKCLNNSLRFTFSKKDTDYEIKVWQVDGGYCTTDEKPAAGYQMIDNKLFGNASGKIRIVFAEKTYEGSFTKTGAAYLFNWPYDSGVVFTKKLL